MCGLALEHRAQHVEIITRELEVVEQLAVLARFPLAAVAVHRRDEEPKLRLAMGDAQLASLDCRLQLLGASY